jgi:hypothetical protein
MIVLFATIPLMLVGIAIATVPLIVSMLREEKERRVALAAEQSKVRAKIDAEGPLSAAA